MIVQKRTYECTLNIHDPLLSSSSLLLASLLLLHFVSLLLLLFPWPEPLLVAFFLPLAFSLPPLVEKPLLPFFVHPSFHQHLKYKINIFCDFVLASYLNLNYKLWSNNESFSYEIYTFGSWSWTSVCDSLPLPLLSLLLPTFATPPLTFNSFHVTQLW